ncbi:MAG: class I SAM-dependent rRNA methyltransferase [Deltaproteobacteria bacterium]|nr:class I SAM-dependent rRNA methyltransferase [Deltaproteobacteria bacterium]
MENLAKLIEVACSKRGAELSSLDLYRVFDGAADGCAKLFIDRIGPFCLAHILDDAASALQLQNALQTAAPLLANLTSVRSVYARVHSKDPKSTGAARASLLFGEEIPEAVVKEHGLSFLVRPQANVNAGIFLDTRELRGKLLRGSQGMKVLNTFCFTGSLGIAAYAGGADEVVQVDSSKAILNWARENFEINKSLGQGVMRFICEDCLTFLGREARRIQEGARPYSLVILDPPSFGKAGTKVFSLRRDLAELISAACRVLEPHGALSLTVNARSLAEQDFKEIWMAAIAEANFEVRESQVLQAPQSDFRAQGQASIAAKGIYLSMRRRNS